MQRANSFPFLCFVFEVEGAYFIGDSWIVITCVPREKGFLPKN
jgi:hypothetical protein